MQGWHVLPGHWAGLFTVPAVSFSCFPCCSSRKPALFGGRLAADIANAMAGIGAVPLTTGNLWTTWLLFFITW